MDSPPEDRDHDPADPPIDVESLLAAARTAQERGYSPYSGVRVGAALLDASGKVHLGCNVENASYGLTICAERTAIGRAVSDGARELVAIAITTNRPGALTPCGACRQVLSEFAPDLLLFCEGVDGKRRSWRLGELLPDAFTPEDLGG